MTKDFARTVAAIQEILTRHRLGLFVRDLSLVGPDDRVMVNLDSDGGEIDWSRVRVAAREIEEIPNVAGVNLIFGSTE